MHSVFSVALCTTKGILKCPFSAPMWNVLNLKSMERLHSKTLVAYLRHDGMQWTLVTNSSKGNSNDHGNSCRLRNTVTMETTK